MVYLRAWRGRVLAAGVVLTCAPGVDVGGQEAKVSVAEPLRVVHILADAIGESHLADKEVTFELADYAPPAPPISVSQLQSADGVVFISSPPGWHGDWHPAPRRQLMFCLAGELEVTVSDGETREFSPGCVILVEDTAGKGHISRVVGDQRAFMAAAPLTEPGR